MAQVSLEDEGARPDQDLTLAGAAIVLDHDGALFWPRSGLLAVADLHLEKGSSFARRGVLLPPYDTAGTLLRVARVIARYAPTLVIALGDNFHDGAGAARVAECDRAALRELQRGRDWIWLAGNHDKSAANRIGGSFADMLAIGGLTFRHAPTGAAGEISGHLHPVARLRGHGLSLRRRCFASDGERLVMPALGVYAGGLNIRHRAFADVFGSLTFNAHILGRQRIHSLAAGRCVPD